MGWLTVGTRPVGVACNNDHEIIVFDVNNVALSIKQRKVTKPLKSSEPQHLQGTPTFLPLETSSEEWV